MLFFFGHNSCEILTPCPGIEPTSSALEGKILAAGPPEKSQPQLCSFTACMTPENIMYDLFAYCLSPLECKFHEITIYLFKCCETLYIIGSQ